MNGARYLGREAAIGTIAPGKQADPVVVDGDPSRTIADIRKVETVFRLGAGYDPKRSSPLSPAAWGCGDGGAGWNRGAGGSLSRQDTSKSAWTHVAHLRVGLWHAAPGRDRRPDRLALGHLVLQRSGGDGEHGHLRAITRRSPFSTLV